MPGVTPSPLINTIPSPPSMESVVTRLNAMESRLDERFTLNRESIIQMIQDSERVTNERMRVKNEKFEHVYALLAERDRRIEERFTAIDIAVKTALQAQTVQTQAQFAASDKAISKAENAQASYNQTHNDLTRKMEEQYKQMVPRTESAQQFTNLDTKIHEVKEVMMAIRIEIMKEIQFLRESRSVNQGESSGKISQQQLITWVLGLGLAALTIGGIVVAITMRFPTQ